MKKTIKCRIKKSVLYIILCSLLLSVFPIFGNASSFTDIDGHWAETYIEDVVSRGIMSGTSATTFSPSATISRGQFVVALSKCLGIVLDNYVNAGFTDVAVNKYYTGAVKWATDNDILDPITSTTFEPGTALTREMAANAIANYNEEYKITPDIIVPGTPPGDCSSLSYESRQNISKALQLDLISVDANGNFNPASTMTRAHAAVIFSRMYEYYIDYMTWCMMPLFDSNSVTWTIMYDTERPLLRWCNVNLTTNNYYAGQYLDDGMNYYAESGRAYVVESGSFESSNVRFIVATMNKWLNIGGNSDTLAICVPVNTDTVEKEITQNTYGSVTNRNVKRMDIYFNPNINSINYQGNIINGPRLIAHEVFHGFGNGHVDRDIAVSVINTGTGAAFDMSITHLMQYDYICFDLKF